MKFFSMVFRGFSKPQKMTQQIFSPEKKSKKRRQRHDQDEWKWLFCCIILSNMTERIGRDQISRLKNKSGKFPKSRENPTNFQDKQPFIDKKLQENRDYCS